MHSSVIKAERALCQSFQALEYDLLPSLDANIESVKTVDALLQLGVSYHSRWILGKYGFREALVIYQMVLAELPNPQANKPDPDAKIRGQASLALGLIFLRRMENEANNDNLNTPGHGL
jgi:hypothetical protein